MKKLPLLVLLFLAQSFLHPTFGEEAHTLVLHLLDGSIASFSLSSRPRLSFSSGNLKVVSHVDSLVVERRLVRNFEIQSSDATSVGSVSVPAVSCLSDSRFVHISNLPPDTPVRLLTLSGTLLSTGYSDSFGIVSLSLCDLPRGFYLITYNQQTLKIFKP